MDPLSDVLALLRPKSSISVGLAAGGDWAIRFPTHEGIKFNAVTAGECWVAIEGEAAVHMHEGDCFLLTKGRPFIFASDLSLPPIEPHTVYDHAKDGIATCNGGGAFLLIGGRFTFAAAHTVALFEALPALIHVSAGSDQASVLRWSLNQLAIEVRAGRPGGHLLSEHLAHIMLVQILRLHLDAKDGTGTGWFHALADPRMSRAMGALHAEPARRWTVEELARLAGMSRSSFALAFKRVVGAAPMEYLTRWRMLIAGDRLRRSEDSVASVALSLGYESDSAFSTAFKRTTSLSPRQYRQQAERERFADPG